MTDFAMSNSKATIFVQIPSYRDPELIPTLRNMIAHAFYPELLRIVVCWQHGEEETLQSFEGAGFVHLYSEVDSSLRMHLVSFLNVHVKLIDVHYLDTCGCGWARNAIQRFFQGEAYSLQIDSHHRFAREWDKTLASMLESLRPLSQKPILTGYPPSYDPDNDPQSRHVGAIKMDFERFCPPGVVRFRPSPMENYETRQIPMRARFLSGGFVFADGLFVKEVPNDPAHFFSSEEISTAVRAYTHGYDLFHPHRVVIWHQYSRGSAPKVWEDHTPGRKAGGEIPMTSKERAIQSYNRTRTLLGMGGSAEERESFDIFGLGKVRTLQQYEHFAGLSFSLEAASDAVLNGEEPSEPPVLTLEEWEDSLVCTLDVLIYVEPELVDWSLRREISISIGIYASHDREVYRIELSHEEIGALRNGRVAEQFFNFSTSPSDRPVEYKIFLHDSCHAPRQLVTRPISDDLVQQFIPSSNA